MGFEATNEFARKGAETILACRNMDKANKASDRIKKKIPDAKTVIMQPDFRLVVFPLLYRFLTPKDDET
ncbi:MAG: hypothetical protein ACXABI_12275 [Candidatus Hodarchaeales archaeon]